MKESIKQVHEALKRIKDELGVSGSFDFDLKSNGKLAIAFHIPQGYNEATRILRELGIGKRTKTVYPSATVEDTWHTVAGEDKNIFVIIFARQLPPTCHLEQYVERIPKRETVEVDNEFIEINRTKVVCDGEPQ